VGAQIVACAPDPTTMVLMTAVALTPAAAAKVFELLTAEAAGDMYLRIAVRPGGCSGFSYEMFFDSETPPADDIVDRTSGVTVVVDPSSAQLLAGATLDYKDGLTQAGFSISNPSASRSCGCGQSFS
jgi:iron-sulfur cluster assembly accessory protein